jgi:very-short-patch-repair endonuclease
MTTPTQRIAKQRRGFANSAEMRLWEILSSINRRALRGKVIREWAFGGYWILDFYIPELRLGIEVDGATHTTAAQRKRDHVKELALAVLDIELLRLSHDEILYAEATAVNRLIDALDQARVRASLPQPLRIKKEVPATPSRKRTRHRPSRPFEGGWTSISQGDRFVGDNSPKEYVDEGIGGSREDNKRMRGRDRADMRRRAKA